MKTTSTANRVAAKSSEKPEAREAPVRGQAKGRRKIESILVPVDFSPPAKGAFQFALELAEQYDARVHLLHVIENFTSPDFENFPLVRDREQLVATVKKELVAFARTGSHPVVPVYPDVRVGSPWQEIVEAARQDKIDLIIIPTHGYTGWKHLLIGSVAERVVRHAPCPVLALRGKVAEHLTVPSSENSQLAEVQS
jgi:universal stress protein A